MNNLNIYPIESTYKNPLYKETVIKEINKFRLSNKNNWFQVHIRYNGYEYKMKIYNTWVQLNYTYKDDGNNFLLYNNSSNMDMNVKEFKNYLNKAIK